MRTRHSCEVRKPSTIAKDKGACKLATQSESIDLRQDIEAARLTRWTQSELGELGTASPTAASCLTTIQEQTRYALNSCRNILKAAGTDLNHVVEVQVLLARPDDFAGLNEEYAKFFKTDPPIRSVARLGPETPGVLVSIKMIAVVP